MTDEDLDWTSAQGWQDTVQNYVHSSSKGDGVHVLDDITRLIHPLLGFLDANITVNGMVYDPANAAAVVNPDGSITLTMPSSIGEINFDNIRIKGTSGASFGSISLRSIDLTGTTITVASLKR